MNNVVKSWAKAEAAGLLAQAGVTGDQDIFGAKGFFDLYGAGALVETPVRRRLGTLSVKLYPCCYAAHRLIAAAVQARTQIPEGVPPTATIEVATPFGATQPLRVSDPQTGAEAQFCAAYAIAVGLSSGGATLADFTDAAAARPDMRALMGRISVSEDALVGEPPVGLDHGSIRLAVRDGGRVIASAEVAPFPGSPADPASAEQLTAKISDCLEAYGQASGRRLSLAAFQATVRRLTGD
ncbi:MAG: hypothetical protein Q8M88_08175 [Phenylobacterium sp.]|uniref:hypothetical protein n=1 Tax=Phenylobacterium sp. TaxID=1871053 RepID=UPI002736B9C1|nr:hypothetical protein [Phenylobacterium sp.]MDP3174395.1 hypothetical protein [Phenylobacterium sp.]